MEKQKREVTEERAALYQNQGVENKTNIAHNWIKNFRIQGPKIGHKATVPCGG